MDLTLSSSYCLTWPHHPFVIKRDYCLFHFRPVNLVLSQSHYYTCLCWRNIFPVKGQAMVDFPLMAINSAQQIITGPCLNCLPTHTFLQGAGWKINIWSDLWLFCNLHPMESGFRRYSRNLPWRKDMNIQKEWIKLGANSECQFASEKMNAVYIHCVNCTLGNYWMTLLPVCPS